jgi:hypothetical protein
MRAPQPETDLQARTRPGAARPRWVVAALCLFAVWAALVFAWSSASRQLPIAPRTGWPAPVERRAPPLARFDSGWYLKIAEHGYGAPPGRGEQSEHVFFPLYPLLVGGVSRLFGIDSFTGGLAVSATAMLFAAILFVAEGRRRLGDADALRALVFLLLFPSSFFLLAMYAESLFLLLALLAFAALVRRRFFFAFLFGLLAGLTRLPALALCAPLFLAALLGEDDPGTSRSTSRLEDGAVPDHRVRRWARAALVGAAPAIGVGVWVFGCGLFFGEPGLYFRLQEAWGRGVSPIAGLVRWALALPQRAARSDMRAHPTFLIEYADALLFFALAIWQARRRRWADASWSAGALLLPAATGISASVPRYLVVVYPAFYAMAEVFRGRPVLRVVWWIASAALLLAGIAAFVNWRWVA